MDLTSALENIYISPLELCNLNCKLCYTKKAKNILSNAQILNFIKRYSSHLKASNLKLKSILFCGGEVFTLKNFPRLVNKLIDQGIFITIITNGTIDVLNKIKSPQNCQLLVSFDGPQKIHDQNRGSGNFDKSTKFINSALQKGFPVEIMYLVTPQSYPYIDSFSSELSFQRTIELNFISQKTYFYTSNHPLSNRKNHRPALTPAQIINLKKNYRSLPGKNFGCFQLSLQSNGQLYGCCESPLPLGKISDKISSIIKKFEKSLSPCSKCSIHTSCNLNHKSISCSGCCHPQFLCGYIKELNVSKCQDVVTKFA